MENKGRGGTCARLIDSGHFSVRMHLTRHKDHNLDIVWVSYIRSRILQLFQQPCTSIPPSYHVILLVCFYRRTPPMCIYHSHIRHTYPLIRRSHNAIDNALTEIPPTVPRLELNPRL